MNERTNYEAGAKVLLKADEVAEILGLSRTTIYGLFASGRLASVRIGSARRVPVTALEAFVGGLMDEDHDHGR